MLLSAVPRSHSDQLDPPTGLGTPRIVVHPWSGGSGDSAEVRDRILRTASTLFYQRGVRAVGVDLVVEEAGVAKTSLYRHFRTKDDLIAAFLEREDADFWSCWNRVTELHKTDPVADLEAHLDWIGERVGRPNYPGCRQLNLAGRISGLRSPRPQSSLGAQAGAPAAPQGDRRAAARQTPRRTGCQLSLLINGAFVSSQVLSRGEAGPLLRATVRALTAAARKQ